MPSFAALAALVRPDVAPALLLACAAPTAPARASLALCAATPAPAAVSILLPLSQAHQPLLLREVELPVRSLRCRLIVGRRLKAPGHLLDRERADVEERLDGDDELPVS